MESSNNQADFIIKIALVGDSGVGKTNFSLKYTKNSFKELHIPTIGVEFESQILTISGKSVKLQIWDIAGQERYRPLTTAYFKGAKSILIIYSITDKKSFESITNWMKTIQSSQSEDNKPIIYLIGNKNDLEQERQVTFSEGEAIAKEFNFKFLETSAFTGSNVKEVFQNIAENFVTGE